MSQFYTLLTAIGQAKLANAISLDQPFSITDLAVGDGGGTMPAIDASATALVNEVRRAAVNRVETDADNPNWLIVEQVLPPDVGGWTIREAGVYDADGDLIAVGTYPATYKPQLAEGASRTQTIRFVMMVSDTAAITLKVDPAVVLATRGYVDDKLATQPQAEAGTDNTHFSSPLRVFQGIKTFLGMTQPGAGGGLDADTVDTWQAADLMRDFGKVDDLDALKGQGNLTFHCKSYDTGAPSLGGGIYDASGWQLDDAFQTTQFLSPRTNEFYIRVDDSGGFAEWVPVLTGGNTTVDSNGFIKQSSPIARLYLDRIETNSDFDANLAKQAIGVYRIDDTAGLARSGWQIETPRDANGQIVLYVATRELADHTIEITTYTPVWTDGVVGPGAPVDIPEGRWIDLRLAEPDTDTEAA